MTLSTLITDYMGEGVAASRPASLSIASTALGLYYATDTGVLSAWNGSSWVTVTGNFSLGAVSALAGSLSLNTGTLTNEAQGTITLSGATTGTVTPIVGFNSYLVNVGTAAGTIAIGAGTINGQTLRLDIKQGATAHTVTFDSSVIFGTDITSFTASASATLVDMVQFVWNGAHWRLAAINHGFAA